MSILSSLAKLIKGILRSVLKFVRKVFSALAPILLIAAFVFYAPAIGAWLGAQGAPAFLVNAINFVGQAAPYVADAFTWVWSGAQNLASTAWNAFKGAELQTKMMVLTGTAAAIAPEETAELVGEVIDTVVDIGTSIGGAVGSALFDSPIGLAVGALGLWFLFARGKDKTTIKLETGNDASPA